MKYLWTKSRRSSFLLVRIKFKHTRKWIIPVSFWVLEETLQALYDVVWICEKLVQVWKRHGQSSAKQQWIQYVAHMPVSSTIKIGSDILRDLRRHGRFRLVEVEDEEIQVYVDMF